MADLEQQIYELVEGQPGEIDEEAVTAADITNFHVTRKFKFSTIMRRLMQWGPLAEILPSDAAINNRLATRNYVDTHTASKLYPTASGGEWATLSSLIAGPWYHADGTPETPTTNEWANVNPDTAHGGDRTRYVFNGTNWIYDGKDNLNFTPAQQGAIDSGITAADVTAMNNGTRFAAQTQNIALPVSDDTDTAAKTDTMPNILQWIVNKIQGIRNNFLKKNFLGTGNSLVQDIDAVDGGTNKLNITKTIQNPDTGAKSDADKIIVEATGNLLMNKTQSGAVMTVEIDGSQKADELTAAHKKKIPAYPNPKYLGTTADISTFPPAPAPDDGYFCDNTTNNVEADFITVATPNAQYLGDYANLASMPVNAATGDFADNLDTGFEAECTAGQHSNPIWLGDFADLPSMPADATIGDRAGNLANSVEAECTASQTPNPVWLGDYADLTAMPANAATGDRAGDLANNVEAECTAGQHSNPVWLGSFADLAAIEAAYPAASNSGKRAGDTGTGFEAESDGTAWADTADAIGTTPTVIDAVWADTADPIGTTPVMIDAVWADTADPIGTTPVMIDAVWADTANPIGTTPHIFYTEEWVDSARAIGTTPHTIPEEYIDFPEHYDDTVRHVTQADKDNWNNSAAGWQQGDADTLSAANAYTDTENENDVKLVSAVTQVVDSDIAFAAGKGLYGTDDNGTEHTLIKHAHYSAGQQTEVASKTDALCINYNSLGWDGTAQSYGDNIPVNYKDTTGTDQVDAIPLMGKDIQPLKNTVESLVMGGIKIGSFTTKAAVPTVPSSNLWLKTPTENDFFSVWADEDEGGVRTQYFVTAVDLVNDTMSIQLDGTFTPAVDPDIQVSDFTGTALASIIPNDSKSHDIYWGANTANAPDTAAGMGLCIRIGTAVTVMAVGVKFYRAVIQTSSAAAVAWSAALLPADIADMEVKTNKVTSVSASSTDVQYPSALAAYKAADAVVPAGYIPTQKPTRLRSGNFILWMSADANKLLVDTTPIIQQNLYNRFNTAAGDGIYFKGKCYVIPAGGSVINISDDEGITWYAGATLPGTGNSDFVFVRNGKIVVCSTNKQPVLESADGVTFTALGTPANVAASIGSYVLTRTGRLIAADYNNTGTSYSDDGGTTWQAGASLPTATQHNFAYALLNNPAYPDRICFITVVGNSSGSGAGSCLPVYSDDDGVTWTVGTDGKTSFLQATCIHMVSKGRLYTCPNSSGAFRYSDNGGASWSNTAVHGGGNNLSGAIWIDNHTEWGILIWKANSSTVARISYNGGASWEGFTMVSSTNLIFGGTANKSITTDYAYIKYYGNIVTLRISTVKTINI